MDLLRAKCGAVIQLELSDCASNQLSPASASEISVQVFIVDGQQYDQQGLSAGNATLQKCQSIALLLNNKRQPLLTGTGMRTKEGGWVEVPMVGNVARLPGTQITDSSEALLSGRKPPFRLVAFAVDGSGIPLEGITPAVSEKFVVATRRTRAAGKADIPLMDDSVSKLDHMGKETVKKLHNLAAAAQALSIGLPPLPCNSITKVGEFKQIVQAAEADALVRTKLMQLLKLSKEKWEEARDHALRAVVPDNRLRLWRCAAAARANSTAAAAAEDGADDAAGEQGEGADIWGLVVCCFQGTPELHRLAGVVRRADVSSDGKSVAQATPMQSLVAGAELQRVRQLHAAAIDCWGRDGHPGWQLLPYDSQHFEETHKLAASPAARPNGSAAGFAAQESAVDPLPTPFDQLEGSRSSAAAASSALGPRSRSSAAVLLRETHLEGALPAKMPAGRSARARSEQLPLFKAEPCDTLRRLHSQGASPWPTPPPPPPPPRSSSSMPAPAAAGNKADAAGGSLQALDALARAACSASLPGVQALAAAQPKPPQATSSGGEAQPEEAGEPPLGTGNSSDDSSQAAAPFQQPLPAPAPAGAPAAAANSSVPSRSSVSGKHQSQTAAMVAAEGGSAFGQWADVPEPQAERTAAVAAAPPLRQSSGAPSGELGQICLVAEPSLMRWFLESRNPGTEPAKAKVKLEPGTEKGPEKLNSMDSSSLQPCPALDAGRSLSVGASAPMWAPLPSVTSASLLAAQPLLLSLAPPSSDGSGAAAPTVPAAGVQLFKAPEAQAAAAPARAAAQQGWVITSGQGASSILPNGRTTAPAAPLAPASPYGPPAPQPPGYTSAAAGARARTGKRRSSTGTVPAVPAGGSSSGAKDGRGAKKARKAAAAGEEAAADGSGCRDAGAAISTLDQLEREGVFALASLAGSS